MNWDKWLNDWNSLESDERLTGLAELNERKADDKALYDLLDANDTGVSLKLIRSTVNGTDLLSVLERMDLDYGLNIRITKQD